MRCRFPVMRMAALCILASASPSSSSSSSSSQSHTRHRHRNLNNNNSNGIITCPDPSPITGASIPLLLDLNGPDSGSSSSSGSGSGRGVTVTIENTPQHNDSKSGIICLLYTVKKSSSSSSSPNNKNHNHNHNSGSYMPISRSYNGYNWERVAGPYISKDDMDIQCESLYNNFGILQTICTLSFEMMGNGNANGNGNGNANGNDDSSFYYEYYVTSYTHELSNVDYMARFYERVTFGPTVHDLYNRTFTSISGPSSSSSQSALDIDADTDTDTDIDITFDPVQYVSDQMNESITKPTLHRSTYRSYATSSTLYGSSYSREGTTTHPCQSGALYRRAPFHYFDLDSQLTISQKINNQRRYALSINGYIRTFSSQISVLTNNRRWKKLDDVDTLPNTYQLCKITRGDRTQVWIIYNDKCSRTRGITSSSIDFRGLNELNELNLEQPTILEIDADSIRNTDDDDAIVELFYDNEDNIKNVLLAHPPTTNFNADQCSQFNDAKYNGNYDSPPAPIYLRLKGQAADDDDDDDSIFIYQPRIKLQENTLDSPLSDGGGYHTFVSDSTVICANVPRNIFNEHSCRMADASAIHACAYNQDSSNSASGELLLTLNHDTLVQIYDYTKHFIYAIQFDIEADTSIKKPCARRATSRWKKMSHVTRINQCPTSASGVRFHQNMEESPDAKNEDNPHPYLIDVKKFTKTCFPADRDKRKLYTWWRNACWETIHPESYNVYDFTPWADKHPGGYNAIQNIVAVRGETTLVFPSSHPYARWNQQSTQKHFRETYIGRMDEIDINVYDSFPEELRDAYLAEYYKNNGGDSEDGGGNVAGTVICGSNGESSNEQAVTTYSIHQQYHISQYLRRADGRASNINSASTEDMTQSKFDIWTQIVLSSQDQLRQRMAWALSQIFAVNEYADKRSTEPSVTYYDLFVTHAFGNFKSLLRAVSYSPLMAEMLTYLKSQSQESIYRRKSIINFADENYAREVMQLFSIGLVELNMDGTAMGDDLTGAPTISTYTNDEIEEYARVWTGFDRRMIRGNIEIPRKNAVDPMAIVPQYRDSFPKMGLRGKHVGDGYMMCEDLPSKAYLREGATYRLLGNSKRSELQDQMLRSTDSIDTSTINVPTLPMNSALRTQICNTDVVSNECTAYPSIITLDISIPCTGVECNLDNIVVVQVSDGVYYEYVRPPCVHFPFFTTGNRIASLRRGRAGRAGRVNPPECVDSNTAIAAPACCDIGDTLQPVATTKGTCDNYTGELTTHLEAKTRCEAQGKRLCEFHKIDFQENTCGECCNYKGLFWYGTSSCRRAILIDANGRVGIKRHDDRDYESLTYFRVHWKGRGMENAPNALKNNCHNDFCKVTSEDKCYCEFEEETKTVFGSLPSSQKEVMEKLDIGGAPPSLRDYAAVEEFDGMRVLFGTARGKYDEKVVFEVVDEFDRTLYLKNVIKTVKLISRNTGRTSDTFAFRNPPTLMNQYKPELRDAQYETEATLDHYFYHQNTAPFISYRLLQRFGHSNPSPRFVQAVAEAFRSGTYMTGETKFGSGEYGDLAATLACILLDRESSHVILDKDPTHGSLQEPLLKFIRLMRSMEYTQTDTVSRLGLFNADDLIGEMAHRVPSVFSFFLPEFVPPGSVAEASLVAPEATLLHKTLGMMNGMFSLVKFGLAPCHGGLGKGSECQSKYEGDFESSMGRLAYEPSSSHEDSEIVDQLSTLLTSGRMSGSKRTLIQDAYREAHGNFGDKNHALRVAQQLIISTPEFHSNSLSSNSDTDRASADDLARKSCKKYKAVVHLRLLGGLDSYNLIVPYSGCSGKMSYDHYAEVRGPVKILKNSLHPIDASTSSQPCQTFGIHPKMPYLKQLYDEKDVSFVAGIGVLTKPVTQKTYRRDTRTRLFAHNEMQREIGRLDPYSLQPRTGVIGRINDVLSTKGFSVDSFSVDADLRILEGKLANITKIAIGGKEGLVGLHPTDDDGMILHHANSLNGEADGYNSVFSETWSEEWYNTHRSTEYFQAQESVDITTTFKSGKINSNLRSIAKMIGSNECRGKDRDVFNIQYGGFDMHRNVLDALDDTLDEFNSALKSFVEEMKVQDKWDEVTIVVTSDFGRTLSGNSADGTDHGWSGHSFVLGGSVNGGKIHGKYPTDLSNKSNLAVGRGRLIPEVPWESKWNAVMEWLGIENEDDLNQAMPNRNSFPSSILMKKEDLFLPDERIDDACTGEGEPVTCSDNPITSSPTSKSNMPTSTPSYSVSSSPSSTPSTRPSLKPTKSPSLSPSRTPSTSPSLRPSNTPSMSGRPSTIPTKMPSSTPSSSPTATPSEAPSSHPSDAPSASSGPSSYPTHSPSDVPSKQPSTKPSDTPSTSPSQMPSISMIPSTVPSLSKVPSSTPSSLPSMTPSLSPTSLPSAIPTNSPSSYPSHQPSMSSNPSGDPTQMPSPSPSFRPSDAPSSSNRPSTGPTMMPSLTPSLSPTATPSASPSSHPTSAPSISDRPSQTPTAIPSFTPTYLPTTIPSIVPSSSPSSLPTISPSMSPSEMVLQVVFNLTTDYYSHETTWKLVEDVTGSTIASGPDGKRYKNAITYSFEWSLKYCTDYTFTITDLYGDGLFCYEGEHCGFFAIYVEGERVMGDSDGSNFKFGDMVRFNSCHDSPSSAPTNIPSSAPTNIPSSAVTSSPSEASLQVMFKITTDYYPHETVWTLVEDQTGAIIASGPGKEKYQEETAYSFQWSLEYCTSYTFTIRDLYGDGLFCNYEDACGLFEIIVDGQRVMGISNGSTFEFEDTVQIYNCPNDAGVSGPSMR